MTKAELVASEFLADRSTHSLALPYRPSGENNSEPNVRAL